MQRRKDTSLVVAQRIMNLLRDLGVTTLEAQAALSAASAALNVAPDFLFKGDKAVS
jgi:hypothetical protein